MQDAESRASDEDVAYDFIQLKSTLIKEYIRRKNVIRQKFRHKKLDVQGLTQKYRKVVQWYVQLKKQLQEDYADLEWEERETRGEEDIENLVAMEVQGLVDLANTGKEALRGGSSIDEAYMKSRYKNFRAPQAAFTVQGGGG